MLGVNEEDSESSSIGEHGFTDVLGYSDYHVTVDQNSPGFIIQKYYAEVDGVEKCIAWAAENKVVNGIGENKFAPNSNITREQIALIMYNYSNLHSLDTTESKSAESFKDASDVSDWSKKAVEWAVGSGLLSGKGDGILDPKGNATRAEIATILMRYVEKYDKSGT